MGVCNGSGGAWVIRGIGCIAVASLLVVCLSGCSGIQKIQDTFTEKPDTPAAVDTSVTDKPTNTSQSNSQASSSSVEPSAPSKPSAAELFASLGVIEDYRSAFYHGPKGAEYQKYIVLHDTEGMGSPSSIVNYWSGAGTGVAAHFVVGTDGSVVQCVPLDEIAHHAGYGDTGHNQLYGVEDESRDDFVGTVSIGSAFADYGMNSHSIGIEMVHVGGESEYTEAQLTAVDGVIAYIDAYYGFESSIIDHKDWRSGNSDTSAEFAGYFANYQDHRMHV